MDKIDELLTRGVEKIIPSRGELEKVLRSGKKLRVYQGFDPTSPNLHIGHLVGLRKLRQWQDLGHEVIFLIGDFTAAVGDPTGKDKTRPVLKESEIVANAKTYQEQASKVLNFTGPNPIKIKRNSEWLAKLSAMEVAKLASYLTVQQVIERDMFQKRFQSGADVAISEFFYPFMQGYDSVAMDVDVEVGGSDQLFNMMTGRDLMHKMKRKNKFVMTTALITDSRGNKLGKSEGNAIGITLPGDQLFGMLMGLDDTVILKCFECITTVPMEKVTEVGERLKKGENPMALKKELAFEIVSELHSPEDAKKAQSQWENTYSKNIFPEQSATKVNYQTFSSNPTIINVIGTTQNISASEVKREIVAGSVDINNVPINDRSTEVKVGDEIKVGEKVFIKIVGKK